ncbi:recombinase family protein [Clostridium sp. AF19-22AC]|jgi:DNA invertase Pin-like site-specific DNA recombinase|uniref:recombinase family protein n=1 Tax=Clostridia TaxID=186801 RepID=UPI000E54DBA4|nr:MULTISPECIES: recombinase family protein [Clostridia]RHR30205.1 recombinase family protein [Clostridium sp. AF19-22AC]
MVRKTVYGYARVSSREQNSDRQIAALSQYVPEENILVDKASGSSLERESYKALKGALGLRPGDTLVITSLDRLSRNKQDIKQELEWFKDNGIRLKILDLPTSLIEAPEGQQWIIEMIQNVLIEVLASIAEQERLTIRKRQREGIDAAKLKGKHLGRPAVPRPPDFEQIYQRWKQKEITAKKAMIQLHLSSSTFYRFVRAYEDEHVSKAGSILADKLE